MTTVFESVAPTSPGLTERVIDLRGRMLEFIDGEVFPLEKTIDAGGPTAKEALGGLRAEAKRRGLWALGHPEDLGGAGLSFMEFVHMNEIIGRSEFGLLAVGSMTQHDTIMWNRFGTEAQKRRWLDPLVSGEYQWIGIGLTEPEVAGSDPTQMQTTAVLDGSGEEAEWVVNGHKWFTSWASASPAVLVWAKTDPEAKPHKQFSAIIVPVDTPGYTHVRDVRTMGSVTGRHGEIRLDNVRVPKDNLFGGRGEAFTIAQIRLGPGRIFHCMRWLGQMQRAFELMCDRARTRYAHGSLLHEKGEIRRYIAESAADIQAHRLMTLDAARTVDSGGDDRVAISLIKFRGAEYLHNVIDRAIQVYGAAGVTEDFPLEAMYRHARYARIYDGPDEVHRMVVARNLVKPDAVPPWRR
ncbi:acyl-CoA dehydrogenase family protein [Sporichthya sp.]|uniref:acyl-CoA dehydrogenase family protein n=1 Tax=Sporichthya sp. TaxID=65475 RepID=UPI00184DBEEB|nr:acyl-CoA dehydrogenase family protein [Sporichthya sp.]MBA3742892.1 acyl-CoA dehydrogenase family protein [Sporichthya sp.]